MYIREIKTKRKNTEYIKHCLVEAYRDKEGKPKQRTIMQLGQLDIPKNRWKELAFLLEQRILGQITLTSGSADVEKAANVLFARAEFTKQKVEAKEKATQNKDMVKVDLNSVAFTESRNLGAELVANSMWDTLGFEQILSNCGMNQKQISVAKVLILAKLINPTSELETWRWFNHNTALAEMTPENIIGLGKDSFYDISDILYQNKDDIEIALYNNETRIFSLERKLFLFDLTNTYFEGSAKGNDSACFGKSKEKRTDCPLISLALVVDECGFPVYSKIYKGNQSEPQTLSDIIEELKMKRNIFIGQQKPVIIMDRGIATSDNIQLLKDNAFSFTVIERKPDERNYEALFAELKSILAIENEEERDKELKQKDWEVVGNKSDVYVKKLETTDINKVLAFSLKKEAKEQAMDIQKEKRFIEDIEKLNTSVFKRNIILPNKISERIGRMRQKYIGIVNCYDIQIILSEDGITAEKIEWSKKEIRTSRATLAGCYVIETDRKDLSSQAIWKDYMTITRVESAFRDLKSELGMRPIYHHKKERTDAHLFIGVLAYHLLVGIETTLNENGDTREWKSLKAVLASHQRSTITMTGEDNIIYNIRVSGNPEVSHLVIYSCFGIKDYLKRKKWMVKINL